MVHVFFIGVVQWLCRKALRLNDKDVQTVPRNERAFDLPSFAILDEVTQEMSSEAQQHLGRIHHALTTWIHDPQTNDNPADNPLNDRTIEVLTLPELHKRLSSYCKPALKAVLVILVEEYGATGPQAQAESELDNITVKKLVGYIVQWVSAVIKTLFSSDEEGAAHISTPSTSGG